MRAQSESSCRSSGLRSPRKLTEKSIDPAIAEGVHNEVSQCLRCQTNDICPSERAFRELNRRSRRRSHDIALFFACFERTLYLRQSSGCWLPVIVQLVERDSHCRSSRLGRNDRLCGAKHERRANHYALRREPG